MATKITTIQVSVGTQSFTLHKMPIRKIAALNPYFTRMVMPMVASLKDILSPIFMKAFNAAAGGDTEKAEELSKQGPSELDLLKTVMSSSVDINLIAQGFADAVGALSEHEFQRLLEGMMEFVQTPIEGKGNVTLCLDGDGTNIDLAFDSILTMYRLMLEVARFNKFFPFVLMSDGDET